MCGKWALHAGLSCSLNSASSFESRLIKPSSVLFKICLSAHQISGRGPSSQRPGNARHRISGVSPGEPTTLQTPRRFFQQGSSVSSSAYEQVKLPCFELPHVWSIVASLMQIHLGIRLKRSCFKAPVVVTPHRAVTSTAGCLISPTT